MFFDIYICTDIKNIIYYYLLQISLIDINKEEHVIIGVYSFYEINKELNILKLLYVNKLIYLNIKRILPNSLIVHDKIKTLIKWNKEYY